MDNQQEFNTPILFTIFNRPKETQLVFNEIKKIKPKQLFVLADGPRKESEINQCNQAREIINQIDWPCKVKKNYSNYNLGCKKRMSSGIDWFFENVEQGIILEDDCVPNQSFFWFCQKLLDYYKNDEEIMHISGTNLQNGKNKTKDSYYFSKKNFYVWGWATWKRAWKYYDVKITDWPEYKKSDDFKKLFNKRSERKELVKIMDKIMDNKVDTWDFQWKFTCLYNHGLNVIPNNNLISNIGFNQKATHTTNKNNIFNNLQTEEISFPLLHPSKKIINTAADNLVFKLTKKEKYLNFIKKILKI